MKKIMFNDFFGLTQAVLEGRKTQTRRMSKIQQPESWKIAFPLPIELLDGEKSPLWGAYCWVNPENRRQYTEWIKPSYKEGEIVAIAQRYSEKDVYDKHVNQHPEDWSTEAGWNNKMFVKPELMPHQIKITKVRIQCLQDISDEDCLAEGLETIYLGGYGERYICGKHGEYVDYTKSPRVAYAYLIDKISGKGTWDSNPYVWVYEFELVK